jgi:hypothetical protein
MLYDNTESDDNSPLAATAMRSSKELSDHGSNQQYAASGDELAASEGSAGSLLGSDSEADGGLPARRRTRSKAVTGGGARAQELQQQVQELEAQLQAVEEQLAGKQADLQKLQQALPEAVLPALLQFQQQLSTLHESAQQQQEPGDLQQLQCIEYMQQYTRDLVDELQAAELSGLPLQEAQAPISFSYAPVASWATSPGNDSSIPGTSDASGSPGGSAASSERMPLMSGRANSTPFTPRSGLRHRLAAAASATPDMLMQDNELFDEPDPDSAESKKSARKAALLQQMRQEEAEDEDDSQLAARLQIDLDGYKEDVGTLHAELARKDSQVADSIRALQERTMQASWHAGCYSRCYACDVCSVVVGKVQWDPVALWWWLCREVHMCKSLWACFNWPHLMPAHVWYSHNRVSSELLLLATGVSAGARHSQQGRRPAGGPAAGRAAAAGCAGAQGEPGPAQGADAGDAGAAGAGQQRAGGGEGAVEQRAGSHQPAGG